MDKSEHQLEYTRWLATPPEYRKSKSRKSFAESVGVSLATLSSWEREPGFWSDVYLEVRNIVGEGLPQIMKALVTRAQSGNVQAIKYCMELLDVHYDTISVLTQHDDDQLIIYRPANVDKES